MKPFHSSAEIFDIAQAAATAQIGVFVKTSGDTG